MGHRERERERKTERERKRGRQREREQAFAEVGITPKKRTDYYRVDLLAVVIKEFNLGGEMTSTVQTGAYKDSSAFLSF